MTDPENHDDDHDDLEDEESPPPRATAKVKPRASLAKSGSASLKAAPIQAITSSHLLGIGIAALVLGGVAGWFGHIQKGKADLRAAVAAAPAGSGAPAGPCGSWQTQLCKSTGEQSASCQQAKGATGVLSNAACESAISTLPETLAKIKAARATCDKLVDKLCADLPPGSKTCTMVKDRTPSFPAERCDQMMKNYDKVIAELKQMDEQGGAAAPGGMRPPGMPPGMPGGMPHAALNQPPAHP